MHHFIPTRPISSSWLCWLVPLSLSAACQGLTREEAKQSVEEIKVASQTQALTSNTIELSTHFTIGGAARDAAEELREYIQSQLPCAEVTLDRDQATVLHIEYGALGNHCTYQGQTGLTGEHTISIAKNEDDLVLVDHIWTALGNDRVEVTGTASVEWDLAQKTRHVVHDAVWTRLSDGRTGEGSGDRTQQALAGGLEEGFRVEGSRRWEGEQGTWDLDIDSVEMRWVDPVPQAGSYTLDTPFDKRVELSFARVDDTTIKVTVAGPRKSFDFDVHSRD